MNTSPSAAPRHSSTRLAILGAGLTGLSAALHRKKKGLPFRLFEKAAHPGGHVITLEENGFRFDRTGHLLHLRDAAMKELVLGYLGDDYEVVQRKSAVFSHGVYTRYPYQANTFGLPPEVANECLLGFLKAHYATDKPTPQNFEEFCLLHFGEGFSKHFMLPYNSRLWGVHPREITTEWCQRFVPMPKLEDVVAGAVGLNDRELGYNTSFVYPRRGIGELTTAMAGDVPEIEYQRAPRAIDWKRRVLRFDDETVEYGALLSSAPMNSLIDLLEEAPDEVREAASKLRCNPLYYLDVGTRVPAGIPHHWVYIPETKYPFYRIGCYSHFSAAMAPPGKASFYVELSDRSAPDLDRLLPEVAQAMIEMGIIGTPDDIEIARVRRIDHAYVLYDHAYSASLAVLRPFLERAGIVSAGRYGGWNYSSMEDALLFGRDAEIAAEALAIRDESARTH